MRIAVHSRGWENEDHMVVVIGEVSDDIVTMLCLAADEVVSEGSMDWPGFGEGDEEMLFVFYDYSDYIVWRDRMPFPEDTPEHSVYGLKYDKYPYRK